MQCPSLLSSSRYCRRYSLRAPGCAGSNRWTSRRVQVVDAWRLHGLQPRECVSFGTGSVYLLGCVDFEALRRQISMAVSRHHLRSEESRAFLLSFVHTGRGYYQLNGPARVNSHPRPTCFGQVAVLGYMFCLICCPLDPCNARFHLNLVVGLRVLHI